ncbi:hypothetical protein AB0I53_36555 [Saccharopolyspora sp. NPDC050389]|uniref:hypothetical protein n=1 Tax=Saccharopolyspora sp. NPDC050389 TaxID=3155516 RepID=UPI0033C43F6C
MVAVVLGALIVLSTVAALAGWRWPRRLRGSRPTLLRHPGFWLLVVSGVIYVNQVLCTIYLMRVWHGDPAFIARYLPTGWFALADDNPVISSLAEVWPRPELLSWSLLRVQAFLELPFVVLAYLTICRWFGAEVFRRAAVWPVAVSYTATFCLIELSLANPYTTDDIVLRVASGLVTPWCVARLTAGSRERVGSVAELAAFVISAAALGALVLAVYDTALLYNLGHLAAAAPTMAAAAGVLVVARLIARRLPAAQAGPGITAVSASLGWFLVFFFAPALPIRYGISFGTPMLSAAAGLVIIAAAVACGVHEAARGSAMPWRAWAVELALAAVAGAAAACAGFLVTGGYPEARLLAAAGAFFILVIAVCAALDRVVAAR